MVFDYGYSLERLNGKRLHTKLALAQRPTTPIGDVNHKVNNLIWPPHCQIAGVNARNSPGPTADYLSCKAM
jgi:hypothetical protein